jgi:hypothetical protein
MVAGPEHEMVWPALDEGDPSVARGESIPNFPAARLQWSHSLLFPEG